MLLLLSRSVVSDSATPWAAVARQAPLSVDFPRQEHWSRGAIPSSRGAPPPRDGTRVSCTAGGFLTTEPPGGLKAEDDCGSRASCVPWGLWAPDPPHPGVLSLSQRSEPTLQGPRPTASHRECERREYPAQHRQHRAGPGARTAGGVWGWAGRAEA